MAKRVSVKKSAKGPGTMEGQAPDPAGQVAAPEPLEDQAPAPADGQSEVEDQKTQADEPADLTGLLAQGPPARYLDKRGEKTLTAPCLVFDAGIYQERRLKLAEIPDGCNQWLYHDHWVYLLEVQAGVSRPATVEPMEKVKKPGYITPSKLHRAIQWIEAIQLFKIEPGILEKLNFGLMIGLIVVLIVFLYLVYSSITGGG